MTDTNKTQHSPGPWEIAEDGQYFGDSSATYRALYVIQTNQRVIARTTLPADEKEQANARLIAAAPELLAALHGIMRHLKENCIWRESRADYGSDLLDAARAAIAKATGEEVTL